jgi:hypothetical protein
MKNSSGTSRSGDLATPSSSTQAKKFLEGLANLPDGDSGISWFQANFPHVIEDVRAGVGSWLPRHWAMLVEQEDYIEGRSDDELMRQYWLLPLREALRAVWRAPDPRTKQWGIFRISQDFFLQGDRDLIRTPLESATDSFLVQVKPPRRTERLLLELMRWADLTRCCGNPDCSTPYFIASRRSQKYCSDLCSRPAQCEFKRTWWAEHGSAQRAAKTTRQK